MGYDGEMDAGEWTVAWNLCSNLQMLEASGLRVEELRTIMHTPKHHLKKLKIDGIFVGDEEDDDYANELNADTALSIIAESTTNVEILHFQCSVPLSLGAFDKFIEKNKSTLRSVTISNESTDDPFFQPDVGGMIRILFKFPLLEGVCFDDVSTDDTLKTLRPRGIHFRTTGM